MQPQNRIFVRKNICSYYSASVLFVKRSNIGIGRGNCCISVTIRGAFENMVLLMHLCCYILCCHTFFLGNYSEFLFFLCHGADLLFSEIWGCANFRSGGPRGRCAQMRQIQVIAGAVCVRLGRRSSRSCSSSSSAFGRSGHKTP